MGSLSFESRRAGAEAGRERFSFGRNWRSFLALLGADRIEEAERSLGSMTGLPDMSGLSFLDIGSGSGLFSLAARRLGARVLSFDSDAESVACTQELRRRFFPEDDAWSVRQGSVLDRDFLTSLGSFDVVYSWGVLHHTGAMWRALEHARLPVRPGGLLFIAIYNDQGLVSRLWRRVKKTYCAGVAGRLLVQALFIPLFFAVRVGGELLAGRNPVKMLSQYRTRRGMSLIHDWLDWLGGYPYEVARPEALLDFYRDRGFELIHLKTKNGMGCNELVFRRKESDSEPAQQTSPRVLADP